MKRSKDTVLEGSNVKKMQSNQKRKCRTTRKEKKKKDLVRLIARCPRYHGKDILRRKMCSAK